MKPTDEDFERIRILEESLWRSETRFDRTLMESVFAQDFYEFGRSGRLHSREASLDLEQEPIEVVLPLPDFEVRMISREVAQATYTSLEMHEGALLKGRRSSIWSRKESDWELRFHQGTVLPDATGDT